MLSAGISDWGPFIEKHPHVTLFSPLTLNDSISQEQLLDTIGKVASLFDPIHFMIDRWKKREGMHESVIAFPVKPSETLRDLTALFATAPTPLTHSQNGRDVDPDMTLFHVTIANRFEPKKQQKFFQSFENKQRFFPIYIEHLFEKSLVF